MRTNLHGLLVAAAVAVTIGGAIAGDSSVATVSALNGSAKLTANGTTADAKVGSTVAEGAAFETARGNTAKLTMPDGTELEVEQSTRVILEHFPSGTNEGRIRLESGTIRLDAPQRRVPAHGAYTVITAQARTLFRREKGYVTTSSDQDVVTCIRCHVYDSAHCAGNDYTVRDASTCLTLHDASVAIVTRDRGIQLEAKSEEAMVRTVLGQLGSTVASAGAGEPWWKGSAAAGTLRAEPAGVALRTGEKAELRALGAPGSGDIWWMSADRNVAVVDDVDADLGTCHLHASGSGHTAVVAFDQLGRYTAVPIDVRDGTGNS